jgi:hypothetical protein
MREREGLISRIRQIRRAAAPAATPSASAPPDMDTAPGLQVRVEHLERMVESLQDSVHRESARQSKRIAELEAQIQPATLAKSLSRDARERGL